MILDETQKNEISELAKASEDHGMYTDSIQFFKFLKVVDYYLQREKIRYVAWATFDEDQKLDPIRDFTMTNRAKDMFLAHINPVAYQQVTMICRIDKISKSLSPNVWSVA